MSGRKNLAADYEGQHKINKDKSREENNISIFDKGNQLTTGYKKPYKIHPSITV